MRLTQCFISFSEILNHRTLFPIGLSTLRYAAHGELRLSKLFDKFLVSLIFHLF
jgi:hypothetical protein